MIADDLVANGIERSNLVNVLDVDKPDEEIVDQLMQACTRRQRNAASPSSAAKSPSVVPASADGVPDALQLVRDRHRRAAHGCAPIDGGQIRAGDAVVALRGAGFRSKRLFAVRAILEDAYGPSWHEVPSVDGRSWGQAALTPSFFYSLRRILELIDAGVAPLRGVGHITGGGIPSKFGRVLKEIRPRRASGRAVSAGSRRLQADGAGSVEFETAYRQWNMKPHAAGGPPEAVAQTLSILQARGVAAQNGRRNRAGPHRHPRSAFAP
jgi:phosphoribosylformylglycinamidine cyclo-ligase